MKITPKFAVASMLAISFLLASCASNKEDDKSKNSLPAAKTAPERIEDSVKVAEDSGAVAVKGSLITWKKSALGKAFLMTMALSTSDTAATKRMQLPKVVTFELNGSDVALMEQNTYSIHEEVPSGKLLQSFPVESQTEETVTFKWNYNLASVTIKPIYVTSDDGEKASEEQTTSQDTVLPAVASYLQYTRIQDNRLELRQLSRVRETGGDINQSGIKVEHKESTVLLDIAFSPYRLNPRFQPRLSTKQQGVGFFEVAQIRKGEGGPADIYASRWDLSKEAGLITYRISRSAPPEAVEAMKEGVLYWNHVAQATLGRDIIQVETGADPKEAPRPRTVMIYWVPWSTAGSAYANFLPDPITGEITAGFVFQTNVFFLSGRQRGRRWVNRGVENKSERTAAPVGFRSAALCSFNDPALPGKDPVINDTLDEKISMKMGLDYLRFVISHEVGHTLGLRHNFAGSLASELTNPVESREKFKDYLASEKHEGAVVSSSVMEYVTFRDSVLEGAAIGAKKTFTYDKAAFEWAYGDKIVKADDISAPYFCTDVEGSKSKTFGCSTDDTGPHPLAGHAMGVARNRSLAPDILVETILDAIRPEKEAHAVSVRRALSLPGTHPDKLASLLGPDLPHFIRLGSPDMKAVTVDRGERGQDWSNEKDYKEKTQAFIFKEFEQIGGLPGILKAAYGLDESFKLRKGWLVEAVLNKMDSPDFGRGKNIAGQPYELTQAELAEIRSVGGKPGAGQKLSEAVENALLRDMLIAVTGLVPKDVSGETGKGTPAALMEYSDAKIKTWAPHLVQDFWQPNLAAIGEQLANESQGEIHGTVDGNPVKVPSAKFPFEARLAAMRLYSPKIFGGRTPETWMKDSEAVVAQAIVNRLLPVVRVPEGNPDKAEPVGKNTSRELKEWSNQELGLLKALKAARK